MRIRSILIIVLLLVVICLTVFFGMRATAELRTKRVVQKAQLERNIASLESWIGVPYQVYDAFPPVLGKDLMSEADFNNGLKLKVYLLRRTPPRFLIVKFDPTTGRIIGMKVEDS